MKVRILALSNETIKRLDEFWGAKRWKISADECESYGCKDVTLSPAAIIKVNGDNVFIDLGGRKECITEYEFYKIIIE